MAAFRRLAEWFNYPWPIRKLHFEGSRYRNRCATGDLDAGCNLIGFAHGEFGIGQHLRGVVDVFLDAGLPFSIFDYSLTLHPQDDESVSQYIDQNCLYHANLFCLNNNGILDLWETDRWLFHDRYGIAYGYWELSDFPDAWLPAMNVLDEIWAPSSHIMRIISAKTALPVLHMPPCVDFTIPGISGRSDFGIPDNVFVFLFSFDFSSTLARKNPLAAVRAFSDAFPNDRKDVMLILKSKTNEDVVQQVRDREALGEKIDDPRILLLDRALSRPQMLDLINCADAYISLHRAEGFGLGMAEAMKMGKPVIATNYSGNTDFTTPTTACLVDYQLVAVKQGECFDLEGDSVWAEADVEMAAHHMARLVEDAAFARDIGRRGKELVDRQLCARAVGKRYRDRLRLIGLLP